MRLIWLGFFLLAVTGCGVPSAFECDTSDQCIEGGATGVCQPSGYCSFPDPACEDSGQRYGDSAADGLRGVCVGAENEGSPDAGGMEDSGTPDPLCGLGGGVIDVAAGFDHTCAVTQDGSALCFGANNEGQLGDGTEADRGLAAAVVGLADVRSVHAGGVFSCAVTTDGRVFCWGENEEGSLGDGTTSDRTEPAVIPSLDPVDQLDVGDDSACAVVDGSAWCWGDGDEGQLGDGQGTNSQIPVEVPAFGTSGVAQISVGDDFACAVTDDGSVWCWGSDSEGQLAGDGDHVESPVPVQVSGLTDAVQVSAGLDHVCAVMADGRAFCWGDDSAGQLGNADNQNQDGGDHSHSPEEVVDVDNLVLVAAADDFTCGLTADGAVFCWGENGRGQLGTGDAGGDRNAPVGVTGLPPVASITAQKDHACAWTETGEMFCWGQDDAGQLGTVATGIHTPTPVTGLPAEASTLEVGGGYGCVSTTDQTVCCWGRGNDGQLGNDTFSSSSSPVSVVFADGLVDVAAGTSHACAIDTADQLWCWGANWAGQVGDGTTDYPPAPVAVETLSEVVDVAAGDAHTCAVDAAGAVWCWGLNGEGQLGDGTRDDRSSPVQVSGLINATAIAAGYDSTCALATDMSDRSGVYCWGANWAGQLGTGDTSSRELTPVRVALDATATAIAAGRNHACARTSDGELYCWGQNNRGALGDGTDSDSSSPILVTGVSDVSAVAAGRFHTCALTGGGAIWCWGENQNGQLGYGESSPDGSLLPMEVVPASVIAVSAGHEHTCGIFEGGDVYCWGSDTNGALGSGRPLERSSPIAPAPGRDCQ